MNTCPVYRRSGGHSYGTTVPGPIGSILAPVRDAKAHKSLPFACSLCGSCTDVCPVKIDLHHQLLTLRGEIGKRGLLGWQKKMSMKMTSKLFQRPKLFNFIGWLGRKFMRFVPRFLVYSKLNAWGKQREIPEFPKQSFREMFAKRTKNDDK